MAAAAASKTTRVAQQIGALPSVLPPPPPPAPRLPGAMTLFLPKWKQERRRQVGPMLFRSVSGLPTLRRKIPKRLENEAEVSLVSASAVQRETDYR